LVEDLRLHVRVQRLQPADLAVLLGDQLLVERCDLDVDVEVGKVEVRGEALCWNAVRIPGYVEGRRFVFPDDPVEVQELCELPLAVVGKGDLVVWRDGAVRSAPCPGRRYVQPSLARTRSSTAP
jgi:hypothetical protein